MKTYELTLNDRTGIYCFKHRNVICRDFVRYFLRSHAQRLTVNVSTEPFADSKAAEFEDDDCLFWVEFASEGEAHPVYEFPGRILRKLTRNTGGKFHFKIEEAK